ncbi:bromodomain-containing protein DDB_G0270170 isoform X2 [Toxorhynchites rutilus septentrionalis]|uniref:bromodomain-containing protein DDB_G0270170 isoform X2 n=1 Tax=Toxorhynchites rutilus septentrionalis TaxID=329112 RepID=UPI002479A42C|nr:bromodomain-containing protein DDB_G0270170 isoform X2 [Toxorhynchites rutilus septentrionalis]XP_055631826.1 bromodomain-containing protein DDB_G0270170 isoform X2 [Toxorhynchites rutilus septentrionalis]XP_055631833.1 bromodomain-containing protein DDB_G0270170 isoform X2 [Toxorhynchites rutilus septentrionalis]XP_055631841.1 bromodomain-containing protein DDB_G0270170 isoform X2 [Toxorhynchites rutilus septentrionalis]XP_055631850.1 bromodomain-containing protein DDB_G0270170 isoform X2 [
MVPHKIRVSAIVEYDYTAKETDELTLKKGAIITNIKIQPGGWWEGTLTATGRTGMFPDNFVRVLEPDDKNPVVLRDKTATLNRRCKVIYSYRENKPDELTLAVGDVIEIFEEVEEGWWRGKLNGKIGVFPSNFVEPIESASPTSANRRSSTGVKPVLESSLAVSNLSKSNSLNKSRSSLNSSREDLDHVTLAQQQQQQLLADAPSLPPKPVRELCRVLFAYAPANDDELKLNEGDIITILTKDLPDKGWWKGELRGRIGVFPDNFVVLLPPEVSPVKETMLAKPERPPPGSKVSIGKHSGTNQQQNSSYRKESFGSKDSLNEPSTQSTGSPTFGNVAAHRKSLEHRNMEISAAASNLIAGTGAVPTAAPVTEKPPRKSLESKTSEIRKSLENLDEKKATPPPVLGKKPQVPIKKSPSITSVTGNLFSGLKQKVKGESKSTSQDSMDGVGGSKMRSEVADNNEKNISGERLSKDESEFGHVERGSVLKDMRANRAKAPKRRPPTSAGSIISDSGSNGMSNGNSGLFHQLSQNSSEPDPTKPDLLNVNNHTNANNEDEFIAKPKAREWEKHKVPWMDELKASQAKKTSPNVSESKSPEHLSVTSSSNHHHQHHHQEESKFENISKSFHISSSSLVSSTVSGSSARARLTERSATASAADVTSSTTTINNNNNNNHSSFDLIASSRKETSHQQHALATANSVEQTTNSVMTKSMSALSTKIAISSDSAGANNANDTSSSTNSSRPISVNLRNRSISPTPISRNTKTIHITSSSGPPELPATTATVPPSNNINNNNGAPSGGSTTTTAIGANAGPPTAITSDNVCSRVQDLEQKVNRMERQLSAQNGLIEELKRLLRDESDKVKTLQKELEKYAQCVTQV